jgi:STI1 domain
MRKVCLEINLVPLKYLNFVQASAAADDALGGLGGMFSDPSLFAKLAANPRTSKYLADPSFVQKVCIF